MKKFPCAPFLVSPLYAPVRNIPTSHWKKHKTVLPQEESLKKPDQKKICFQDSLEAAYTEMYEPVSDGCVTIIKPKYDRRNSERSDVEEEHANVQPPDKPPRRTKPKKYSSLNRRNCEKMRTGASENHIDVDHVILESDNNYKNKFLSVAVQTSPFAPYRLRFWPKLNSDVKCDPSGSSSRKDKLRFVGRTLSQWLFSQIGLTVILFNWTLLGAAAFYKTEGPREQQQTEDLESFQKDLAIDLATTLRQVSAYSQVWPQTIYKFMERHEVLLLEAISAGYGEGGGGRIWTYPGCILFAISLLTTLGFGAPVPRTALGRGAALLFSAIGKLQQFGSSCVDSTSPVQIETPTVGSRFLKWFPFLSVLIYYLMGVVLFGFVRSRHPVDCLMFPLDFTAAGGVAKTSGHVRILYALYLEVAVMLAATIVALLQVSATRGIVGLGLQLGLLVNT